MLRTPRRPFALPLVLALLCVLVLGLPNPAAWAHGGSHDLAVFEVEQERGGWWLEVRFAREEAAAAMAHASPLLNPTDAELKSWIVSHVRETASFFANGEPLGFGPGGIRLTSTLSTLRLELVGMPEELDRFDASVSSFSSAPEHRNLVRLRRAEGQTRVMLDRGSGFSATVWRAPLAPSEPDEGVGLGCSLLLFVLLGGVIGFALDLAPIVTPPPSYG